MDTIKLNLDMGEVVRLAKLELFYSGEALKDTTDNADAAANVQAGDDNDDILEHYLRAAKTAISSLIPDIKEINLAKNAYVEFYKPDNFDINQIGAIEDLLICYMTNIVVARWLQVNAPERAEFYLLLSEGQRKEIRYLLTKRTSPILRPVRPLGF